MPEVRERDLAALLAAFVRDGSPTPEADRAARRSLATALPLAVSGASSELFARLELGMRLDTRRGRTPVPGTAMVTGMREAALLTGAATNSDDFDDTDMLTLSHPSAAVVPAAMLVAREFDADIGQLLRAIAIGLEVSMRLGRAMGTGHADAGWHPSATATPVGAAAAGAALLPELTPEATATALNLTAVQSSGLGVALGTMVKPLHFGRAAQVGIEAVLLSLSGYRATEDRIGGEAGMLAVLGAPSIPPAPWAGLGSRWQCVELQPKPYPCGVVSHPILDAGIAAHEVLDGQDPVDVHASVHPLVLELMGRTDPTTPLEAKLSAAHLLASALSVGRVDLATCAPALYEDAKIGTLRRAIVFSPDQVAPGRAELSMEVGGRTRCIVVEDARGSLKRPLTDDEVRDKAVRNATAYLGSEGALRLADACLDPDRTRKVKSLETLLVGKSTTRPSTPGRGEAGPGS